MERDEFELAGLNSWTDLKVKMGDVILPIAPQMSEQVVDIPAKFGNMYLGTDYTSKQIEIPVTIMARENQQLYLDITKGLASFLVSDRPDRNGQEYDLRFGFDPDVYYRGHVSQISKPTLFNKGVWDAQLTITFTLSDPRGFGPAETIPLQLGHNNVSIKGTAMSDPIIQMQAKDTLHYAGATINGEDLATGPEDVDEQNQAETKWVQVVNDDMGDRTRSWSTDADAIAPITTAGTYSASGQFGRGKTPTTMTVNTKRVKVNGKDKWHYDFGPNHKGYWHGPMGRYKGLSKSLTDFQFDVRLHHKTYSGKHNGRAMGDVEFLGLDSNGKSFIRCAIKSLKWGQPPYVLLQVGRPGTKFEKSDDHITLYHGSGVGVSKKKDWAYTVPMTKAVKGKKKIKIKVKRKRGKSRKPRVKTKTITYDKKKATYAKVHNYQQTSCLSDGWVDFHVERVNGEWAFSIVQMDLKTGKAYVDGRKHLVLTKNHFTAQARKCKDRGYNTALGGFGVCMFKYDISEDFANPVIDYKRNYLSITNLVVYEHNEVPYEVTHPTEIAHRGDCIEFNCETDQIRGGSRNSQLRPTFSTSFPKLVPGTNSIYVVAENDQATARLIYRPRYL